MGRTVVAGVRSSDKAATVFSEMGVRAGRQEAGTGLLFVESGLDVTVPETLKRASLWKGVSQVMFTVGGVFGPLPGGGFGTIDNMTSERVEAEGEQAGEASGLRTTTISNRLHYPVCRLSWSAASLLSPPRHCMPVCTDMPMLRWLYLQSCDRA